MGGMALSCCETVLDSFPEYDDIEIQLLKESLEN